MKRPHTLCMTIALFVSLSAYAQINTYDGCCVNKGSVQYCDASTGRYVCGDGDYSSCYCTRHAVMELQKIEGCCTWKGGVMGVDHATGLVICNNGCLSEMCSIQHLVAAVSLW